MAIVIGLCIALLAGLQTFQIYRDGKLIKEYYALHDRRVIALAAAEDQLYILRADGSIEKRVEGRPWVEIKIKD